LFELRIAISKLVIPKTELQMLLPNVILQALA